MPHYFHTPEGAATRRLLTVRLGGRDRGVETAAGVFSGDRLDPGTAVLLDHVPDPPALGHLLDLGCGWGPVALTMALASPAATVWAVDVNDLALELTHANARRLGLAGVRTARPEQVPVEVELAAIWSNPPIRVGKAELHATLLRWLPRLAAGAEAHLVVQRHLGADSLHRWLVETLTPSDWDVDRIASAKGYRVLRVVRAR